MNTFTNRLKTLKFTALRPAGLIFLCRNVNPYRFRLYLYSLFVCLFAYGYFCGKVKTNVIDTLYHAVITNSSPQDHIDNYTFY